MRTENWYGVYFIIRQRAGCYELVDKPWSNYVHTLVSILCICFCIGNQLLLGGCLLFIMACSMMMKKLMFAKLYQPFYFAQYRYEKNGNKYSFQHPRCYLMQLQESDYHGSIT